MRNEYVFPAKYYRRERTLKNLPQRKSDNDTKVTITMVLGTGVAATSMALGSGVLAALGIGFAAAWLFWSTAIVVR